MILENAEIVSATIHTSQPIVITELHIRNTFFGTSLMNGGKGAVSENTIEEDNTVEVEPISESYQLWG